MTSLHAVLLLVAVYAVGAKSIAADISTIWLTHAKNTPETMVINWESNDAGSSVVEYGETAELGIRAFNEGTTRLHHVEIPLGKAGLHYRVQTGRDVSSKFFVRGYSDEELRVAVVADLGYAKVNWVPAILKVTPNLLLTAGDNVPALHSGAPVANGTTTAFSALVKKFPELFCTTRIMPALGNHDREVRPRGPKPPPEPVYDVEAIAFRDFFALPDEEWRWHFDLPNFGVRFVALDLNHLGDLGTTWQTCHSPAKDGPQFGWYRDLIAQSRQPFVVTIYNERNGTVRGLEKGEWARMIERGSMAVTGFGYFAERAEVDGFPYFNTSVQGTGDKYPDPKSTTFVSENNFLLLTFRKGQPLQVEIRNLDGAVLDRREILPRR